MDLFHKNLYDPLCIFILAENTIHANITNFFTEKYHLNCQCVKDEKILQRYQSIKCNRTDKSTRTHFFISNGTVEKE